MGQTEDITTNKQHLEKMCTQLLNYKGVDDLDTMRFWKIITVWDTAVLPEGLSVGSVAIQEALQEKISKLEEELDIEKQIITHNAKHTTDRFDTSTFKEKMESGEPMYPSNSNDIGYGERSYALTELADIAKFLKERKIITLVPGGIDG